MAIRQILIVIDIWLFITVYGQIISPDNQTRLFFNEIETPYKGHLEAIVDTDVGPMWTPICFGHIGEKEAKVACKSFGFLDFDTFFTNERLETVNYKVMYDCRGYESALSKCIVVTERIVHWCNDTELICTAIPLDSDYLRINPKDEVHKGRLQINYNGNWGPVYNEHWNSVDSRVACRQLGFIGVIHHNQPTTERNYSTVPIADDFSCNGQEKFLHKCGHGDWLKSVGNSSSDVFLTCIPIYEWNNNITFRLVDNGGYPFQGRLEIKYNTADKWGSVCNNDVSIETGHFICTQLGFIQGAVNITNDAIFGAGTGDIVLSNLHCAIPEGNITNCEYAQQVSKYCDHSTDLSITCVPFTEEAKPQMTIKLTGSETRYEGLVRLSYSHGSEFGTICSNGFNLVVANVICRELNFYQGVYSFSVGEYDVDEKIIIMLNNISCTGNESRLIDCKHDFVDGCTHDQDVSVVCIPITEEAKPQMTIKLTGSEKRYEGLVRLSYSDGSEFGTICSNGFNLVVANVICGELNFYQGAYSFSVGEYDVDEKIIIMLNNISCTGKESRLIDCKHDFVDGCTHAQDVSVVCIPITEDSFVTFLFGKFGLYEGMVSVYDGEDFNQACPDHWGQSESEVVCNELDHKAVLYYDIKPQQDLMITYKNPIFNFKCNGTENSLLNCVIVRNNRTSLCSSRDYAVRVECIRYLPDFFNTSANTSELLYNVDYFLTKVEDAGNLSSASFGYFVIDSPTINATNQLELLNSEPFTYSFYAHHNEFSEYLSSSSYLMSSDLAKINATGRLPFLDESSNVHLYAFGGVFGLNVYTPLGENVNAKASFMYTANLSVPFEIDVPLESSIDLICTYFDPVMEYWSSAGIITTVLPNDTIKCESEHTTSFSIMMKVTIHEQDNMWDTILSVMTYLCLGLSISAAIPTFVIFVSVR
ncbi:deleted in malignant brain tumors 1 protein-like [Anneissia japonica]|uniref:deleted in malignant brain tumors 1 protein-like n=1 Tax=Anneissia japonica TaxID=1529436 RepID=UPI001425A707|nr:deleted in malignant brain tumors 1 protein-like [Anneissia japonica]